MCVHILQLTNTLMQFKCVSKYVINYQNMAKEKSRNVLIRER